MAQNITLLGATYSDVPSVLLPKTGGGTASFTDVTDTTAAAADVAAGKYFFTAAGVLTAGTASGGGGGLEYETGTWTPASDIADYMIPFAKTHTTAPFYYLIYDTGTNTYSSGTNSMISAVSFGSGIQYNASSIMYGTARIFYAGSASGANLTSSSARDSFFSSTGIRAYTNSSTRYWRAGHTYNWIAVWAPTS